MRQEYFFLSFESLNWCIIHCAKGLAYCLLFSGLCVCFKLSTEQIQLLLLEDVCLPKRDLKCFPLLGDFLNAKLPVCILHNVPYANILQELILPLQSIFSIVRTVRFLYCQECIYISMKT